MKLNEVVENAMRDRGEKTHVEELNRSNRPMIFSARQMQGESARPEKMKLDQDKDKACQHILEYLLDNPEAGDTLEGIADWWLLKQRIRFETLTVAQAVAQLVNDGLVSAQQGPDSRIIYRANRSSENIQALLYEMQNSSDD